MYRIALVLVLALHLRLAKIKIKAYQLYRVCTVVPVSLQEHRTHSPLTLDLKVLGEVASS